ncbi:hypothetical protein KAI65_03860 [Candidatus Parcubacteria bacterium]|nr:hypothetical protein [Candidatus Parcubacteria bacterium]
MKDRILVVEDNFPNMIGALAAFHNDENVEDVIVIPTFKEVVEKLDEFKPTVALLDIHIIGGTGKDVGKILKEKSIPYIYLTGISIGSGHHAKIVAIAIKYENAKGELKTLLEINKTDKDQEVWRAAYEKLNKIYNRK